MSDPSSNMDIDIGVKTEPMEDIQPSSSSSSAVAVAVVKDDIRIKDEDNTVDIGKREKIEMKQSDPISIKFEPKSLADTLKLSTADFPHHHMRPPTWTPKRLEAAYGRGIQIGEGTYGSVYQMVAPDGRQVAIKQIKMEQEKEGFPLTAIREIKTLKKLHHKNIVELQDVISDSRRTVFTVFEFMDHDLNGLLDSEQKVRFSPAQIKLYLKEIIEGLEYCHRNKILHRDVKGANVLISNDGRVKLADFGLARSMREDRPYTKRVVTLWYRAPELLLGETKYDEKIDMWSVGCLFAELLSGKPFLPGPTETAQLALIFENCGTPTEESWPGCGRLPCFATFRPNVMHPRKIRTLFQEHSPEAVDLLDKLLTLNPAQRPSAPEALAHPYFTTELPRPLRPEEHPRYDQHYYELGSKKRNQRQKRDNEHERQVRAEQQQGGPPQPFIFTYPALAHNPARPPNAYPRGRQGPSDDRNRHQHPPVAHTFIPVAVPVAVPVQVPSHLPQAPTANHPHPPAPGRGRPTGAVRPISAIKRLDPKAPEARCYLHPTLTHTNARCFTQHPELKRH